jgi:agmatinase
MCERVFTTVTSLLEKSKFVVVLGGEHSISYGSVKAHRQKYANLSVLQLDAHSDLRNSYLGTEFSHACVMRRIIDICPITQVGIRSTSREEIDFITARELKPVFMGKQGKALPVSEIISSLAESVYITIDLDVFDPSIMSAVGTPEPGGLLWQETIDLLYAVAAKRRIVGFDLVELCPGQGPESCSFLAAKLAYKLIGFALMQSR